MVFKVSFWFELVVRVAPSYKKLVVTQQSALRILNISFWTQEQDVEKFFDQWTLVPGSVKFKLDIRTGVKIGECAVVFDDINDMEQALSKK